MTAACSGTGFSPADSVYLEGQNVAWPVQAQVGRFPESVADPYAFPTHLEPFPAANIVPDRWVTCPYTIHKLNACQTQEPGS